MSETTSKALAPIENLGRLVTDLASGLGRFSIFVLSCVRWMFRPPYRFPLLFEQMMFVGNGSIFIVGLTSLFTGAVFAFQVHIGFEAINADGFIGPLVAISLAKELGPVFSGLIISGRCGAAMAAQIGTMKVTEQVDALEVMGINAHQYLAVPRIVATTLALPMLMILFLFVGNVGSYLMGVGVLQIDEVLYFSKLDEFMHVKDILEGVIKSTIFGFLVSSIGTYQGFSVKGGAVGVGRGTNMAVVWGMVMVLILDFFLTSFLNVILNAIF